MARLTEQRNEVKRLATWVASVLLEKNPKEAKVNFALEHFRKIYPQTAGWDTQRLRTFILDVDNAR